MKEIIRDYIDNDEQFKTNGHFIDVGIWANGHLAYSQIDPDTQEVLNAEDDGMFVQIRHNHKLIMVHI